MATTTKKQVPLASSNLRAEESKWTIKFYETNIDKLALVGTPPPIAPQKWTRGKGRKIVPRPFGRGNRVPVPPYKELV